MDTTVVLGVVVNVERRDVISGVSLQCAHAEHHDDVDFLLCAE
jgi:hypothetical protein